MKVKIELEVEPGEVALATELLGTLRLLTQHIQGSAPPTITVKQPEPQLAAPPTPPAVDTKETLQSLIGNLHSEQQLNEVAAEVSKVLSSDSRAPAQVADDVVDAFMAVVFNEANIHKPGGYSVVPAMQLLPALPPPYTQEAKNRLISKILKHLTKQRPVNTQREGFFLQAEAFAVLVSMNITPMDGALQTIEKLLKKPDTRSAAMTMLGKTVELCVARIPDCRPEVLGNLYNTLTKVTEPEFAYDLQWVKQHLYPTQQQPEASPAMSASMSVPVPVPTPASSGPPMPVPIPVPQPASAAPAPAPAPQGPQQLGWLGGFGGGGGVTFAMCYDSTNNCLATGGMGTDGASVPVLMWSQQGEVLHRIDTPGRYVCSMDLLPARNLLMMCTNSPDQNALMIPYIELYDTSQGWAKRGDISRANVTLITCLRGMPEADAFLTGETQRLDANAVYEQVCFYDASRAGPNAQPVHVYSEHTNLVTCLAPVPGQPHLFVSGSRDMCIKLWDRRQPTSAGAFGTQDPTTYEVRAHGEMVTSLDAANGLLLSSSWDNTMAVWDLRSMAAQPTQQSMPLAVVNVDGNGIVKVAASGSPSPGMAAVATGMGLYTVDYSQLSSPQVLPCWYGPKPEDRRNHAYNDLRWVPGRALLYAAGEDSRIDLFQPQMPQH